MRIKNKIILVLAIITTVIYIVWRIFWSLPWDYGIVDMIFAVLLLVAEIIGFIEALNYITTSGEIYIPEKPVLPDDIYPEVDVFIATYNEDTELLRKTVNGCLNMDYPDKNKVHIYLCDDGGRSEIESFAREMGVGYFKREDHKGAKAGNYNNALQQTYSPYIATFDADMIPMHDFLTAVIPYFYMYAYEKNEEGIWSESETARDKQKKVGFIQTPQSFYNSDLFQFNLYSERDVPNEQDFFFRTIQGSRNKNNAAIYAGSNTILSREALEEVGGFYDKSITEDIATGLKIQSAGYTTVALDEVHANGLAPVDIESLFKQRLRWARGCIQTMRQLHIFFRPGITLKQRYAYICCLLYWYTPIRRVIFILSPIIYVLFNIHLLQCELWQLVVIWLPHYIFYTLEQSSLSIGRRTSRLSNVYDTILCWHLIPGVILETLGIKKSKFEVTRKKKSNESAGDEKRRRFRYAVPHFLAVILSVISLLICTVRTVESGSMLYAVIFFWLIVNLYSLIMALFFLMGRESYRQTERYLVSVPVSIQWKEGKRFEVLTKDLSEGGFSFELNRPEYIPDDMPVNVKITDEDKRYKANVKAWVVHVRKSGNCWRYSMKFDKIPEKELLQFLQIIYDRLPSLPVRVDPRTGFVDDLKKNMSGRVKGTSSSNRKLPRVEMNRTFPSGYFKAVKILNFNYVCVLLEVPEKVDRLDIIIDETRTLKCSFNRIVEVKGQEYLLYDITNKDTFVQDEEFIGLLAQWAEEEEERKLEAAKQEKLQSTVDEDEFREEIYL